MVNILKKKRNWVELSAIYFLFVVLCFLVIYSIKIFSLKDLVPQAMSNEGFDYSLSYYVDNDRNQTVDSLLVTKFKPNPSNLVPFTMGLENNWVKIDVVSNLDSDQKLVIHFDNSMINELDVHRINNFTVEKSWFIGAARDAYKATDQIFPKVNFTLKELTKTSFLVRMKTDGASALPILIYSEEQFEQLTLYTTLLYGGFIAILITLIIYNLIIYSGLRDRLNLIYASYLTSMLVMLGLCNGYAYYLLPSEIIPIMRHFIIVFHYTTAIILLYFTLELFDVKTSTKLYKIALLLIKAMAASCLALLFLPEYIQANVFFTFQFLLYLTSGAIIYTHLNLKVNWSRFYVISWVPLLIGAAIQPMVMLGHADYSFLSRNSLVFAVSIEVIFIAFALTEKFRQMDRSRYQFLLYNANSGLPNFSLLREKTDYLMGNGQEFTLVVFNGKRLAIGSTPEMKEKQEALFSHVIKATNAVVKHNNLVLPMDTKGVKLAHLRGYTLALVLDTCDELSVQKFVLSLQTTLMAHQPIADSPEVTTASEQLPMQFQVRVRSDIDIIRHTLAEVINDIHISFCEQDPEIKTQILDTHPLKFG